MHIAIIIPAYNEAEAIGKVVTDIPPNIGVQQVIVVSNGSTDATEENARKAGAIVLSEPRKGYGYACLCGIDFLQNQPQKPDIVVFMDGDYADFPEEIPQLVAPIFTHQYDMVIGSRVRGNLQANALTPQQVFGNALATFLIRYLYKVNYTDLGPFRAIKWEALQALHMQDKTYGWTVEMQIKAAKRKLKTTEIPVSYRVRIGTSKVSGTLKGTIMAGYKILGMIAKEYFTS